VNGVTHCGTKYTTLKKGGGTYAVQKACVTFRSQWRVGLGKRFRFTFGSWSLPSPITGHAAPHPLEADHGNQFVDTSHNNGGIAANWSCWFDYTIEEWTFDITECDMDGAPAAWFITEVVNMVIMGRDYTDPLVESCFPGLTC